MNKEDNEIDEKWAEAARLAQRSWTLDNPWDDETNNRPNLEVITDV